MSMTIDLDEILGPHGLSLVGNAFDIDAEQPHRRLRLTDSRRDGPEYCPIFKLNVPGGSRLVLSGADLMEEVCDDTRFDRLVSGGLAT